MRPNWLATCKRCASDLTSLSVTSLAISEATMLMLSRPKCWQPVKCNPQQLGIDSSQPLRDFHDELILLQLVLRFSASAAVSLLCASAKRHS